MPEQSPPPSFSIPPKPTDNLFLGIFPDIPTASRIAGLARQLRAKHGLRGRQYATDRFHVTLYSFDILKVDLQAVSRASAAAAASTAPFEVGFDCALSFPRKQGNRPFVLGSTSDNTAPLEFFKRLGAVLEECGFRFKGKLRFTPHITLLYDEQSIAEEPVDPVSWKVNEFVVVHSLVGNSRYIHLAHWSLHG